MDAEDEQGGRKGTAALCPIVLEEDPAPAPLSAHGPSRACTPVHRGFTNMSY